MARPTRLQAAERPDPTRLYTITAVPRITLFRWRVRDPLTGRLRTTRYLASEQDMKQRHPDAELVPGSREERDVGEGDFPDGLSAGHVQRGPGR
jgi:hypothetical protein